jgi:hypothetical protein
MSLGELYAGITLMFANKTYIINGYLKKHPQLLINPKKALLDVINRTEDGISNDILAMDIPARSRRVLGSYKEKK